MWTAESEIETQARELGVWYRQLDQPDAERVWLDVQDRYADGDGRRSLFDRLANSVGAQAQEGWRHLPELLDASPLLILTDNDHDRLKVFEFATAADFVTVFNNTALFDFYAVPEDYSALVGFNNHEYLMADGDARGPFEALGL